MSDDRHSMFGDDRLRDSRDKQVGIRWPMALDQRLDDLMERANDAGANTTRRETLAALLLAADYSGDDLVVLIRRYRTATVKDAPLNLTVGLDNVLKFTSHKPGPRTAP